MNYLKPAKSNIIIEPTKPLYKWAKVYGGLQKKFFNEPIGYRREKQIESFIYLNEFVSVEFMTDTDVLHQAKQIYSNKLIPPELLVVTDQKFSRYPCHVIVEKIKEFLLTYPALYICLNRCYINIDNSFNDPTLSSNYTLAISQWLKKSLNEFSVLDLGLDVNEEGLTFTWVIPDRHFYITKNEVN
jgi:hypothetical protein